MNDLTAAHIAAQGGGFEEQRNNNALLRIFDLPGNDNNLITLALQSFPLPKTNVEVIESAYLNEKRKFAGNVTFDELSVVFKDFVDKDIAQTLKRWHEMVYDPKTGRIGLAKDYKKRGEVELFAPDGSGSRKWTLEGIWPSTYDPGEIDMGGGDTVKITLGLQIDKAYFGTGAKNAKEFVKSALKGLADLL